MILSFSDYHARSELFERLLAGKGLLLASIRRANLAWKADSNVKREMRESFGDRLLHHTEIVLIKGDKLPHERPRRDLKTRPRACLPVHFSTTNDFQTGLIFTIFTPGEQQAAVAIVARPLSLSRLALEDLTFCDKAG